MELKSATITALPADTTSVDRGRSVQPPAGVPEVTTETTTDEVVVSSESAAPSNEKPAGREGSIPAGLVLAGIGAGLIAAASTGIPAAPAVGFPGLAPVSPDILLNPVLRFCGVIALMGAHDQIHVGSEYKVARGTLLTLGGVAGMAAAAGLFGEIGGLTALALAIGGFISTLNGIQKLSS